MQYKFIYIFPNILVLVVISKIKENEKKKRKSAPEAHSHKPIQLKKEENETLLFFRPSLFPPH